MTFRLRPDVDDWFKHIANKEPLKTKFDLYYLCLMMGLALSQCERAPSSQEFVQYFVGEYRPVQRLVLGLFIMAEMARRGLDVSDREEVRALINEYLDPTNPAQLKEAGFSRLNDYANAGYNAVVASFGAKPHQTEAFLQWYSKALAKAVEESPHWSAFRRADLT